MNENMQIAIRDYLDKQSRKTHPKGKFDRGGRWHPSDEECQPCCEGIRHPSRSFPYSLLNHCRSAQHIANLHGVDCNELKAEIRKLQPQKREGGIYYKQVVQVNEKLLSIFDGVTEYVIGKEMRERALQNHNGGYYVYRRIEEAKNAVYPSHSYFYGVCARTELPDIKIKYVILEVECSGAYCVYDNKLAFSRIKPIRIVENLSNL